MPLSRSLFSFDLIRLPPPHEPFLCIVLNDEIASNVISIGALFSIDEQFDPLQASVISYLV